MRGNFCWFIYPANKKLLVLDVRRTTPEFSCVDLPSRLEHDHISQPAFIDAMGEEGRIGMFTIESDDNIYHLQYAALRDENSEESEPGVIIHLPLDYENYRFMGVARGYLLLMARPLGWHWARHMSGYGVILSGSANAAAQVVMWEKGDVVPIHRVVCWAPAVLVATNCLKYQSPVDAKKSKISGCMSIVPKD